MKRETNFQDYLDVIIKRRWLIIACAIVTTLGALLGSLRSPKIYQAQVKFKLDLSQTKPTFFSEFYTPQRIDPVESELEIIRSRAIARSVVKKLGLNLILKDNKRPLFDSVQVSENARTGRYFLKMENGEFILSTNGGEIVGRGSVGKLFDNGEIKFLLKQHPRENLEFTIVPLERATDDLLAYISANQIRNTDLVLLKVKYFLPELAALIANTIAQEYIKYSLETIRESARGSKEFIESQIAIFGLELDSAEEKLRHFKQTSGVFLLSETAEGIISSLAHFETEKEKAVVELHEAETSIKKLEAELSRDEASYGAYKRMASFPTISNSPLILNLKEQLKNLELQRQEYLLDETKSRELKNVEEKIEEIKEEINKVTRQIALAGPSIDDPIFQSIITSIMNNETKAFALQSRIEALNQIINRYNLRLKQLPEAEVNLAQLERQKKANEEIYTMLLSKLEESKIAEAMQISDAKIIDYAITPDFPVEPRVRQTTVFGLLLGLLIGVVGAFLLDYLDTSIKDVKEIEEITGISVLATIPKMQDNRTEQIPVLMDSNSEASESYRILRTNLLFAAAAKPLKSLLVTSTAPQEGKTTTIINLGIIFTQTGSNVLILDCDFRRPMLHRYFKNLVQNNNHGLSDVLVNRIKLKDAIITCPKTNLKFITSGTIPSNPAELLGSPRMENLLNELRKDFDILLIDAPPALGLADARVLGKLCDGILIVIRSGKTNRDAVIEIKEELQRAGEKIVGYVLNGIDITHRYHRHRYYYYHHPTS